MSANIVITSIGLYTVGLSLMVPVLGLPSVNDEENCLDSSATISRVQS